eukprot:GHVP01013109.1.p1 GENE.GHVP01013109.1~~GHVP01013109.1.p1  ORF type:complete len:440 (-),score=122.99 GHVP01013109.1:63-1382(-)
MNRKAPMYSFPELKPKELLACLGQMDVQFSEAELNKPTPQSIQRVFEDLVIHFLGITRDDYKQPSFDKIKSLSYPDQLIETNSIITLGTYASSIMLDAGIEDFSLKDMIKPERTRLMVLLSAIINMAKFREEQLPLLEELTSNNESTQTKKENLRMEIIKLEDSLINIQRKKADEESERKRIDQEIKQLEDVLRAKQEDQNQEISKFEEIKCKRNTIGSQLEALRDSNTKLEQHIEKLKTRVVQSPEKLFEMLEDLKKSVVTETDLSNGLESRMSDLDEKNTELELTRNETQKMINALISYSNDKIKRNKLDDNIRNMSEEIEIKAVKSKEIETIEEQTSKKKETAEERLRSQRDRQEKRRKAIDAKLEEVHKNYEKVSQERVAVNTKQEEISKQIKEIEGRIVETNKKNEIEISGFSTDFNVLKTQILSYVVGFKKSL